MDHHGIITTILHPNPTNDGGGGGGGGAINKSIQPLWFKRKGDWREGGMKRGVSPTCLAIPTDIHHYFPPQCGAHFKSLDDA